MDSEATVFVVDDDKALRASLRRLMTSVGYQVETYASAQEFLDGFDPDKPGCLVLDIRMPGMSGLDLQQALVRKGLRIPIIIISAHANVEQAVRAMKGGALDLIRKPYKAQTLLERIKRALELDVRNRQVELERATAADLLATLTPREREVLDLLVGGLTSKQIAFKLGLSRKTVDVHRGHIVAKLQVDSVVELVRLADAGRGAGGAGQSRDGTSNTTRDDRS